MTLAATARDRAARRPPLRHRLADRDPGQPARPAGDRARDVAGHARRRARPDPRRPGRAAHRARRPLRRLHRLGGPRLGPSGRSSRSPSRDLDRDRARDRLSRRAPASAASPSAALGHAPAQRSLRARTPRRRSCARGRPPRSHWLSRGPGPSRPSRAIRRLRIRVLDVGQGDSILLEPRDAPPVLIDTGPPEGDAAERLARARSRPARRARDHARPARPLGRDSRQSWRGCAGRPARLRARAPPLASATMPACPDARAVAAGERFSARARYASTCSGRRAERCARRDDPNARSLVLRARVGRFDALLAGDAEAELAPVDPGPVDVLKVAHHGSADAGLAALLARAVAAARGDLGRRREPATGIRRPKRSSALADARRAAPPHRHGRRGRDRGPR